MSCVSSPHPDSPKRAAAPWGWGKGTDNISDYDLALLPPSIGASLKSRFHCTLLFSTTFVLKYDYEFLTCILKKMTWRGKKCYVVVWNVQIAFICIMKRFKLFKPGTCYNLSTRDSAETKKQKTNKTRIAEKRFLTELQRGYFFWREGAVIHTQATIKPCRQPLHATESHVRLKHKLIHNIVPFWKTFVTKKKKYHF